MENKESNKSCVNGELQEDIEMTKNQIKFRKAIIAVH
jgi:hypothetical protein